MVRSKLDCAVGFSNGWAALALKKLPPLVPSIFDGDLCGDRTDCEWCSAHVASDMSIGIERGPGRRRILPLAAFGVPSFSFRCTHLDLIGAYYHYDQPAFGAPVNCANAAALACHGTFDAVSFVADWQFAKKFDAYAGIMFSEVNGGLANGFLNRSAIDPTVGLRFRF
jgi:hypothetical protein